MDELAKVVKQFLYRDAAYVVGGSAVIVAFCYLFDRQDLLQLSTAGYFLLGGIGYGIGYAVQDGLSLTRLVTTTMVHDPRPFVQWLYERFSREPWRQIDRDEARRAVDTVMKEDGHFAEELKRIENLIIVGTALGPTGLVA